ncbi:hypothetical protein HYH02_005740 [Chlamydomonas schloesseri]|uniref:C3H1-type domain-containing protein n=1 Tax=Chlamydomonas schloesseri TaxID=2026947 RepID=A0A836B6E4_9CHLO|nr:hypothetical protein HYH02_005740 [Chlamydomonas schloesseri]|eukprot:KAG2448986.1 hypothetical protein HYH02_005740 [Chlamydomonas schloesseri]
MLQAGNFTLQPPGGTSLCHLLSDEALLRKLAPSIATGAEDCVSALRSLNLPDSFWCHEFKVVPCAKTFSHKWTLCPCAHIGETARRRCPRTVNYKAVLCPLVKAKKTCPLGDACGYAHNVFEHWLHPSRYKTRLCSFGRNCNRSICFFAHSAEELRCVPAADELKEGDERDYLMQLIMAQESGLLPPTPGLQAPLSPSMMSGMNDLLSQALRSPLPPSGRPSLNGVSAPLPSLGADPSGMISARQSMNGLPDLMTTARASLSGIPEAASAAAAAYARASMSGVPDPTSFMAAGLAGTGRASMSGLAGDMGPHGHAPQGHIMGGRSSLNGLAMPGGDPLSVAAGMGSGRPSLNGMNDPANMLLSMSVQNSMQRALSSELNSGAAFNTAAMQRALSSELASGNMAAAAAAFNANAAQAAMERAFTRELAAAGATSPLHSAQAAAAAMERAYSQREVGGGVMGGGATASAMERALQHSRSMGSGSGMHDRLAHTPSVNSVESDSLLHMPRGGGAAGGSAGHGQHSGLPIGSAASSGMIGQAGGMGGMGFMGGAGGPGMAVVDFEPQAPPRLSDPGSNFGGMSSQLQMQGAQQQQAAQGLLSPKDFARFETLLPLVNNALASGALNLPAMRRSNSGNSANSNSGRVVSPPLVDAAGSPTHSGSRTPPSPNGSAGAGAGSAEHPVDTVGSPARGAGAAGGPGVLPVDAPSAAAYEGMLRRVAAAAAAGGAGAGAGAAPAGVDQGYLTDLVARLQDQGVNKEQLVSSLSQLLAQLLSVGN